MDISQRRDGGAIVIAVVGRLDSQSSAGLVERMRDALGHNAGPLVLDCTGMTFINSAGIRAILLAAKQCRAEERRLALFGANENVRGVIEISGITQMLTIHSTRDSAVMAVG